MNPIYTYIHTYQFNAQFLYSITIYMSYHNPQQILSRTLLIIRRTNCITTSSGIFTLEIGERSYINHTKYQLNAQFFYSSTIYMLHYAHQHVSSSTLLILLIGLQSALHLHTVRLLTEGDDTRGCGDTIGPPEDEQRAARNMLRSVV